MTNKTDGLEVVAYMVKLGDVTCFEYVKREQSIPLVTHASAQAAVAFEQAKAGRVVLDTIQESTARITALEAALAVAHAALKEATYYMTDNSYNGCKASEQIAEALATLNKGLK